MYNFFQGKNLSFIPLLQDWTSLIRKKRLLHYKKDLIFKRELL